jgi:hypothetical protein
MKEQLKMGLMAAIAILLAVIAFKMFTDDSGSSAVAEASNTASSASTNTSAAFDPLSNTAETATAEIDNTPKTTMQFETYDHDFGQIKQDTENKKVFSFTNTGTEPLIIESAKGSCGCTVPNYPKNPIAPGEKGEIEVVYKPGKQKDLQNKNVTIVANTEPKQTILRIKANVEEVAPIGG